MEKYGVHEEKNLEKTASKDGKQRCPWCREEVDAESSPKRCPRCGTEPFEGSDGR